MRTVEVRREAERVNPLGVPTMSLARRHPLTAFLVVTYALGVLIFAFPLLAKTGLGVIPVELPGAAPFVLLSALALAGVAFLITGRAEGRDGVRDLRRRAFRFGVSPVWYVVAILILPVVALATAMVAQGTAPLAAIGRDPNLIVSWLIDLAVAALVINFWEELGWTGFALHRLQPRIGPLPASVVTTWMQGALHLPLVFIAGGVVDDRVPPDQYPVYLIALFVLPIGVRIILTWLYNRSGHSVPIVGIYHAGLGIATGSAFLPAVAPGFAGLWVYAGFGVLAAILVAVTRGRLGYEGAERESTASRTGDLRSAEGAAR